jgi:hypothetical protein
VTLLESNVDNMPLIYLLDDVSNEVVSIHRGHIAKARGAGVCGDLWSGGSFNFLYLIFFVFLLSLVSRFLAISSFSRVLCTHYP